MRLFYTTILILIFFASCTEQQKEPAIEESVSQDTLADSLTGKPGSFTRNASSVGQLVYVPVYSHIYQRDGERTFNLTTTLSIRNTDPYRSLVLTKVSYYDSKGNLIQHYIDTEVEIDPLASTSYIIEERDLRGGVGANFLVNWKSKEVITPPVIEAVNISTSNQQGVSFLSVGRVLQERVSTDTSDNQ